MVKEHEYILVFKKVAPSQTTESEIPTHNSRYAVQESKIPSPKLEAYASNFA